MLSARASNEIFYCLDKFNIFGISNLWKIIAEALGFFSRLGQMSDFTLFQDVSSPV